MTWDLKPNRFPPIYKPTYKRCKYPPINAMREHDIQAAVTKLRVTRAMLLMLPL